MAQQKQLLDLPRCPHCQIARPTLTSSHGAWLTRAHDSRNQRSWAVYQCSACGGVVLTESDDGGTGTISHVYPAPQTVSNDVPDRARAVLLQAIDSLHSPAAAVLLAAGSVDSMLKAHKLSDGSLYDRIKEAEADHLITPEMAIWAHDVRLDANAQRHSDESVALPTTTDARRTIDFALALADFLFVLPARVTRGRQTRL